MSSFDVVVVGGGQAGLSASYELRRRGIHHVVLERTDGPGGRWKSRWETFCLVTINDNCRLPGYRYDGNDPEGFMSRDEVVAYLARYAESFAAPIECGVEVSALTPRTGSHRWLLSTSAGDVIARDVIVATGPFQQQKLPAWAPALPRRITQLHSERYVKPEQLPDGSVLVVGSGQSGAQIAEELHEAGRRVYLGVSRCGRRPRRYRGRDITGWTALMRQHAIDTGTLRTASDLESPRDRFTCNPHLSGKSGGHEINLRQLALDGVTLLGRPSGARDSNLLLDNDLVANLERADTTAAISRRTVDEFIAACGLDAPEEPLDEPQLPDPTTRPNLDLDETGVTSIVWATGYRLDFSWIDLPGLSDDDGYPYHQRGITQHPGLSFLGLPWLHTEASSLLLGMETDAPHLVEHLTMLATT